VETSNAGAVSKVNAYIPSNADNFANSNASDRNFLRYIPHLSTSSRASTLKVYPRIDLRLGEGILTSSEIETDLWKSCEILPSLPRCLMFWPYSTGSLKLISIPFKRMIQWPIVVCRVTRRDRAYPYRGASQ